MQRDIKTTKITVREDWPVSTASTMYGANINSVAFNLEYIIERDPEAAYQLEVLYRRCRKLLGAKELDKKDELWERVYKNMIKLGESDV